MKYAVFISLIFLTSCNRPELSFEYYEAGSTFNNGVYFVHNFKHNDRSEKMIDDFVCTLMNDHLINHGDFVITFYKISNKTNLEYLKENPEYFYRSYVFFSDHGSFRDDYLWEYDFDNLKFIEKTKLKNYQNYKFSSKGISCMN